jgi:hypothetical protein
MEIIKNNHQFPEGWRVKFQCEKCKSLFFIEENDVCFFEHSYATAVMANVSYFDIDEFCGVICPCCKHIEGIKLPQNLKDFVKKFHQHIRIGEWA